MSPHSQLQLLLQAGAQSPGKCTRTIVVLQEGHLPDWLDCIHSSNRSILWGNLLCQEPSAEPVYQSDLLQDFADTTAPALMPIFQSAKGDTLLLLVRSTPTLVKSMPRPYVTSMMVPLLVRAAEQGKTSLNCCHSFTCAMTIAGPQLYCKQGSKCTRSPQHTMMKSTSK